jgi:membrane protease YdiL (CAAX protease family)
LADALQQRLADLGGSLPLLVASAVVIAVLVAATLGVTFVFRRFVDRRAWEGMACPPPWRRPIDLLRGLAIGGAILLVVAAVEYGLGWYRVLGWKEGMSAAVVAGLLCARLIYFVGTAVCEELAYRGYLLQNVGARYPIWLAVLITGAVFGLSHIMANGFSWRFVVAAVLISFVLSIMRLLTRAIWLGVGWHLGWDWAADGLGLVPGYSPLETERLGPALWAGQGLAIEGGLLIIILLTVALVVSLMAFRRSGLDWNARLTPQGELVTALRADEARD